MIANLYQPTPTGFLCLACSHLRLHRSWPVTTLRGTNILLDIIPFLTRIVYSDETWSNILAHGDFDYIVVGSGFTALAFIQKTLELDPCAKILCIERGGKYLVPYLLLESPSDAFICYRFLAALSLPEPANSLQDGSWRSF